MISSAALSLLQYKFRYEGTIGEVIDANITQYSRCDSLTKDERNSLTIDIVQCYYRYRAHPKEYFMFGFPGMSTKRRKQFLTQRYKDFVMTKYVGLGDKRMFLEDKWRFYNFFHEYFKRDVICLKSEGDLDNFLHFIEKHPSFIIKPLHGQCGKGIQIIRLTSLDDPITIFKEILSSGEYIVEELIKQDKAVSSFNESTVNTVRLPSFYSKNGYHVLKPFLRLGRRGAIVDNAATGGVFSVVDEKTGVLTTDGFDEFGHNYVTHPDSGITIKGFQIPKWDELLKMAEEIHAMVPDQPYIGWDFALSDKGWMLVEGNWGQFMSEWADKEGIKDKFDYYFGLK